MQRDVLETLGCYRWGNQHKTHKRTTLFHSLRTSCLSFFSPSFFWFYEFCLYRARLWMHRGVHRGGLTIAITAICWAQRGKLHGAMLPGPVERGEIKHKTLHRIKTNITFPVINSWLLFCPASKATLSVCCQKQTWIGSGTLVKGSPSGLVIYSTFVFGSYTNPCQIVHISTLNRIVLTVQVWTTGGVMAGGSGWVESWLLTRTGSVGRPEPKSTATRSVFWSGGRPNGKSEIVRQERDSVLCAMWKHELLLITKEMTPSLKMTCSLHDTRPSHIR